jgi:hypothetical protein
MRGLREGRGVFFPFHRSQDRFKSKTRLIHKHAEQSFAIFETAKVASITDEDSSHSPKAFKTNLDLKLERFMIGFQIL